ncbi:hypothetical protein [Thermoplasma acidophilum]|uniref:Uncharacterized protein n=1 Tax=Thermoplasma acidophilum (strain ATCC 25905 / DSM 1728 / JCM 9062 / NBRC 15155 / AMRC-C165) TaxID=273075 RepID=Q9HM20_THEAC|nr:hypothetical protein [Thermoplasma acidophilum]
MHAFKLLPSYSFKFLVIIHMHHFRMRCHVSSAGLWTHPAGVHPSSNQIQYITDFNLIYKDFYSHARPIEPAYPDADTLSDEFLERRVLFCKLLYYILASVVKQRHSLR